MNFNCVRLVSLTWCIFLGGLFASEGVSQETVEAISPNGRIKMCVAVKDLEAPYESGPRLYYSVSFDGVPVILDSPMALLSKTPPPAAPMT